jgi:hypothetical protein
VTVGVVLVGLATHGTYAGSGDEPHYLAIAHSVAFDGDLDLSNNYGGNEPLIAGGGLRPENHALPGSGGALRPVHDIGLPVLAAPYVRVAAPFASWLSRQMSPATMRRLRINPSVLYRHLISVAMIAVACVLAVLLFETLRETGAPATPAFGVAALVALSPPLLVMSILFFTEIASALLVLFVFARLVIVRNEGSRAAWTFAGAATGLLLLVHVRNVAIAGALAALALTRLARARDRQRLLSFGLPMLVFVIMRTLVNHHLWGTWVTTPHARTGEWTGAGNALEIAMRRLAGWFLDQEYGLLPYAPVFVLAFVGLVRSFVVDRRLASAVAIVCGVYLLSIMLPMTNAHGWTGGWSPPARFLVPILPLLALALPTGLRVVPRAVVVVLLALQIAMDAYFWQHPKDLWNDGDGVAAVCSREALRGCGYLPSFVQPDDRVIRAGGP